MEKKNLWGKIAFQRRAWATLHLGSPHVSRRREPDYGRPISRSNISANIGPDELPAIAASPAAPPSPRRDYERFLPP